jgi:glycosyltransferase involved in cell wall biosynthesis
LFAFVGRKGWDVDPAQASAPEQGDQPLVTIGIAHYNLGRHLPQTLASLAAQTYPHLDVVVIDDGSTDADSLRVFTELEARYPQYRFFRQANAGIGATRNRILEVARGEFFIPVDADNLARPKMVERFVRAIRLNPVFAAMTCYFLAFEDGKAEPPTEFLYACRPTGGPHVLAGIRNVYGDANAIFRTKAFRSVGGYETDRGTSCEDWEAFVKLVHAGHRIGVVPEHLFYYRHLPDGFSRRTNWFKNHQRVLRQFTRLGGLPPGEGEALWTALLGFHIELERHRTERPPLLHRVADGVHAAVRRVWRGSRTRPRGSHPGTAR